MAAPVAALAWIAVELARLAAGDAADGDLFGYSVAVAPGTAVVGARLADHAGGVDAGAAYVFRRGRDGAFAEVAKLVASDAAAGDLFGRSVAVSGDALVVGAPFADPGGAEDAGAAYVFERDAGGTWSEVAKLTAGDAAAGDSFGHSVALDGGRAVLSAVADDQEGAIDAGAAYVFERGAAGAWSEVAKLLPEDGSTEDYFGRSVGLSGDTAVVGAFFADHAGGQNAGAAYVFERDAGGPGAWGQAAKLTAGDAAPGDQFGIAAGLAGDTAVVGAYVADAPAVDSGAAYVFERDQGGPWAWGEVAKLVACDGAAQDFFGRAVAIAGDTVVVGALRDDHAGGVDAGSAYVFTRDAGGGGAFGEAVKLTASDAAANDQFAISVAIAGGVALCGASLDDHAGGVDAGSAYAFALPVGAEPYCTAGTSASGCRAALSASGTASASAPSGFVLTAVGVEGAKDGLFFFSAHGRQAQPWGNGSSYQCVVPPVFRAGALAGVGTPGACDGSFAQDLNARWCPTCPRPAHNPGAGSFAGAQLWYRDPLGTSNVTTSLSNAVELLVAP